jgi:hypothetical protein
MSDNINNYQEDIIDNDDDDFNDEDYGFIIGPDGSLKSVMMPEHLMEDPPAEIIKILKIFGIKDIHNLGNDTLH